MFILLVATLLDRNNPIKLSIRYLGIQPIGTSAAGRLCPKGIFVRPRMERYKEESRAVMKIVGETGAVVEQMSIDEAYMDLSVLCQAEQADASLNKAFPIARQLKQRIVQERHLTATIGIAANKLLAKIASDHQKPDGITQITVEEPLTEANDIYRLGCWLLGREKLVSRPLRLLGLGVSSRVNARQLVLL